MCFIFITASDCNLRYSSEVTPQEASIVAENPSEALSGTKIVDGIYIDPMLQISIIISNPEWVYYKDADTDMLDPVLFFNKNDKTEICMVLINACDLYGDVSQQAQDMWEIAREDYRTYMTEIESVEQQVFSTENIGEIYLYQFEILKNESKLSMQYVYWHQGDRMYICVTQAEMHRTEEVQKVLAGILESFNRHQGTIHQ